MQVICDSYDETHFNRIFYPDGLNWKNWTNFIWNNLNFSFIPIYWILVILYNNNSKKTLTNWSKK